MSAPDSTDLFVQLRRSSRNHIPLIPLPARHQFRQNITRLILTTMTETDAHQTRKTDVLSSGLKKVAPYWYPYTTMAKMRWLGRELLEVVSTEFRDRSMEYYVSSERGLQCGIITDRPQRYALESGVTTVNGKIAQPDTVLRDGDRIE